MKKAIIVFILAALVLATVGLWIFSSSDKLDFEAHTLIAAGILGMAVIFAICWLIVNFTGIKNE